MKLKFIFLLVLISVNSVLAENQQNIPQNSIKDFDIQIAKLKEASDYKGLEQLRQKLIASNKCFPDGVLELSRFYYDVAWCALPRDECQKFIDNWLVADKNSPIPYILSASKISKEAFNLIRGSGYVQGKSNNAMNQFQDKMNKAMGQLSVAETLPNLDPEFYNTKINLLGSLGTDQNVLKSEFDKGVKLNPYYDSLYTTMAIFLLPRWGGAPGDVERFATESIKSTEKELGYGIYAEIAEEIRDITGTEFYIHNKFEWDKISKGYADLLKRFPSNKFFQGRYILHARLAEDKPTLTAQLKVIGNTFDKDLDLDEESFLKYVEWSKNGVPASEEFPLITAIRNDDLAKLEQLLKSGTNPNSENKRDARPLSFAAAEHPRFVKVLLEHGADPNLGKFNDKSNLENAVLNRNMDAVKLLLKAGAKPDCLNTAIKEDYIDMLKELLAYNKDVNQHEYFFNPIMVAIDFNRIEAVKLLLARPEFKINEGVQPNIELPLYRAVKKKNAEIVELLLKANADPNVKIPSKEPVYDMARRDAPELLALLTKYKPEDYNPRQYLASVKPPSQVYFISTKRFAGEEGLVSDDVFRKAANNEFKAITKLHDDLVSGAAKTTQGNFKLPAFYSGLVHCPNSLDDCRAMIQRWKKEDTDSQIITVVEAMLEYKLSNQSATDSSKDAATIKADSESHAKKGWELVQKALSNSNADAETYSAAINLAFLHPDKESKTKEIISKLSAKYPDYSPFWLATIQNLISAEKFSEIPLTLETAANANSTNGADAMYARLAAYVSKNVSAERLREANLSFPRVKKGFAEIHAIIPVPKELAADYLLYAVRVDDREAAVEALNFLGNSFDSSLNSSVKNGYFGYQEIVKWSKGGPSAQSFLQ